MGSNTAIQFDRTNSKIYFVLLYLFVNSPILQYDILDRYKFGKTTINSKKNEHQSLSEAVDY